MSVGCFFILYDVKCLQELRNELVHYASSHDCGVCFQATGNLLQMNERHFSDADFIFEMCDGFKDNDASLLLSYGTYPINGQIARLSLMDRLHLIQEMAQISLGFANNVVIFIGEDSPYFPDYTPYTIACEDIAATLYAEYTEYQADNISPFIPCVRLNIGKPQTNAPRKKQLDP